MRIASFLSTLFFGSVLLVGCASSGSAGSHRSNAPTTSSAAGAGTTSSTGAGTASAAGKPTCSAKQSLVGAKLQVTVSTNGEGVVYATDASANPSTVSANLTQAPWQTTISLNDSRLHAVKVTIYSRRQQVSCQAIPR